MRQKLPFPSNVLDQHLVMLGKTGSGKSSKLRVIVEWLFAHNKRVCIVDPKGDWWGIKVAADGKSPGLPFVLFGDFKKPDISDVPINEHNGSEIAELVASGNRPCVIGMAGWTQGAMTRFWIDFASKLFAANKGELYLVGDEFHNFAPKGKVLSPQAGESLHWSNRLLSEGRGLGIVCLLGTQRPQKVHNDSLTSCESLFALRVVHKADRDAIKDWVDGNGDPAIGKEMLGSLASMERPESWVWSPEVGFGPKKVTFEMFETFDSFAPPQLQKRVSEKGWAGVDLSAIQEKLKAVIELKKANDPNELKQEIARLKTELAKKPSAEVQTKEVEVPVFPIGARLELEQLAKDIDATIGFVESKVLGALNSQREKLVAIVEKYKTEPAKAMAAVANVSRHVSPSSPKQAPIIHKNITSPITEGDVKIGKAAMSVLRAMYWTKDDDKSFDMRKLAFFAGYSPNASTLSVALSQLRKAGLVDGQRITQAGLDALPADVEPKPTGSELGDWVKSKVGASARAVLGVLLANPGRSFTSAELAEATGYSPDASTLSVALSILRNFEAIEGGGREGVRAAEVFFE
jgi:hypothetical protein